MKKISIFLCLILCVFSFFGCTTQNSNNLKVVCPDGAPAISVFALKDVNGIDFSVYSSSLAADLITQDIRQKKTDIAILPINLASKLCTSGEDYKMVGLLTHGNLYGVSRNEVGISNLKGKSVGVIQLNSVPGYTVKLMLNKLGIEYTEDINAKTNNNVYLFQIEANATAVKTILENNIADMCIVAEPMCTKLVSTFSLNRTMDVQSVYGLFPQAVMVVKATVLENNVDKVNEIISTLSEYDYTQLNPMDLVAWINTKMYGREDGSATTLSPSALSVEAIIKSNIRFENAVEVKAKVKQYLSDLKIFDTSLGTVAENVNDNFFWSGV